MKRLYNYYILGVMLLLAACNPIEDTRTMGEVLEESQLQLEVKATTAGGNEIVVQNNTANVGSYWDFGLDRSTQQSDTIVFPFLGEQVISFTGFCKGGTVTTTRTVTIEQIDHTVAPEWAILAGSSSTGKTWTWASNATDDIVFGLGGYLTGDVMNWWSLTLTDMQNEFHISTDESMTFDLNGGPNFVKKDASGGVIGQGLFKFDMTKKKKKGDGTFYSIGELTIEGTTVLYGNWPEETTPISTFDIIELSTTQMILGYAKPGSGEWDEAYFWKFKSISN